MSMARTAAVGGMTDTMKLMKRSGSAPPGSFSGPSGVSICARNMRVRASWRPARKLSASAPKFGMATITTIAARIAAHMHDAPDGIPFERVLVSVAGCGHGAGEHREIAKPPGRNAGVGEKAEEKNGAEREAEADCADACGDERRPVTPAEPGNHDRQGREIEQGGSTEARRKSPRRTAKPPRRRHRYQLLRMCIVTSCPAPLSG